MLKALCVALVLLCAAGLAAAADLSKIDRKIAKEPAYKSKPRYMLLVFGQDAAMRVWAVADGTTIYLDRNGNGDLTEAGESFDQKGFDPKKLQEFAPPKGGYGEIVAPGGTKYRLQALMNMGAQMAQIMEEQKKALKDLKGQNNEELLKQLEEQVKSMEHYYVVQVELPGKVQQYAAISPATSRDDAPVYHFGGPLKMWTSPSAHLTRGGKDSELTAMIVTPGFAGKEKSPFGGDVQVMINCCTEGSVAKDIHPLVEIEFPNQEPGGKPIVQKYDLKERC